MRVEEEQPIERNIIFAQDMVEKPETAAEIFFIVKLDHMVTNLTYNGTELEQGNVLKVKVPANDLAEPTISYHRIENDGLS